MHAHAVQLLRFGAARKSIGNVPDRGQCAQPLCLCCLFGLELNAHNHLAN